MFHGKTPIISDVSRVTEHTANSVLFNNSSSEYLHCYILQNKIKAVLTLDTDTFLTWAPCMSSPGRTSRQRKEAALAAQSPGVTSPQYLQRPPPCPGNICSRASESGPRVSCLTSMHHFQKFMKICRLAAAR